MSADFSGGPHCRQAWCTSAAPPLIPQHGTNIEQQQMTICMFPKCNLCLQGGRQLACDVQTLFSVFQPYTFKPAAHFKELRDASLLLAMAPDALHALTEALHSRSDVGSKQLKKAGVLRLSPDQAISIMEQRI